MQRQPLDRTQPSLPMKPGRAGSATECLDTVVELEPDR
jgi:hypothetical protein